MLISCFESYFVLASSPFHIQNSSKTEGNPKIIMQTKKHQRGYSKLKGKNDNWFRMGKVEMDV